MSTGDLQDAKLQEALITFEKLQDIEDDFEEVELEISKSITVSAFMRRLMRVSYTIAMRHLFLAPIC